MGHDEAMQTVNSLEGQLNHLRTKPNVAEYEVSTLKYKTSRLFKTLCSHYRILSEEPLQKTQDLLHKLEGFLANIRVKNGKLG